MKRVDIKLCLNNGLWDCMLALDDVLMKQGLNFLCLGPICLYQAQPPDLRAIEDPRSNNHLHEIEFG